MYDHEESTADPQRGGGGWYESPNIGQAFASLFLPIPLPPSLPLLSYFNMVISMLYITIRNISIACPPSPSVVGEGIGISLYATNIVVTILN